MVEVIIDPITKQKVSYYVEKKVKELLDKKVKKDLSERDKDYVIIMDGYEGAGKSTFAMQIGKYVDPTLKLDRICMTCEEFKKAINNAKKNQCVIYDEAVTGLTSADSISRVGKMLKSLMMQMRQKNLFVIIILPSIFEFNKYAVLSRARWFFHVYESGGRRGYFVGYNRRDTRRLYLKGKKTYSYLVRSYFNGRFYGKYVVDEEEYRKKKEQALLLIDEEEDSINKWLQQRNILIYLLYKTGLTYIEMQTRMKEKGMSISLGTISSIVNKMSL